MHTKQAAQTSKSSARPSTRERVARIVDDICARTGARRPARTSTTAQTPPARYDAWRDELTVSDTLAAKMSDRSLAALIAHQLGHARRRGALLAQQLGTALLGVALLANIVAAPSSNLAMAQVAFAILGLITLQSWLNLREEYAADDFAVRYTGDAPGYEKVFQQVCGLLGQEPSQSLLKRVQRLRERGQNDAPRNEPPTNPFA